jgi:hypothetical protein
LVSYLREREQVVIYYQSKSVPYSVTSGIPQRSNLRLLLFSLFISNLSSAIDCNKLFYADDLKLFTRINNSDDRLFMQRNLVKVHHAWCCKNRLYLNICTHVVLNSRKEHTKQLDHFVDKECLKHCDKVTNLGVVFDATFLL